jgi:hypothetical protein
MKVFRNSTTNLKLMKNNEFFRIRHLRWWFKVKKIPQSFIHAWGAVKWRAKCNFKAKIEKFHLDLETIKNQLIVIWVEMEVQVFIILRDLLILIEKLLLLVKTVRTKHLVKMAITRCGVQDKLKKGKTCQCWIFNKNTKLTRKK